MASGRVKKGVVYKMHLDAYLNMVKIVMHYFPPFLTVEVLIFEEREHDMKCIFQTTMVTTSVHCYSWWLLNFNEGRQKEEHCIEY